MADQITVDEKEYISSKRASELSGYTQDYIGQLARAGNIDARRIGGLWFVFMESLEQYRSKAEEYKPQPPPQREESRNTEAFISFDGRDYVSAARAAEITSYHQDYVGQLARGGTILSRQVGNRWYVDREGLVAHKKAKDALLGAVQAESVGLPYKKAVQAPKQEREEVYEGPALTYTHEDSDLMPILREAELQMRQHDGGMAKRTGEPSFRGIPVPPEQRKILDHSVRVNSVKSSVAVHGKTRFYGTTATVAFLVVIASGVLYFALSGGGGGTVAENGRSGFLAAAGSVVDRAGYLVERLVARELVYKRPE